MTYIGNDAQYKNVATLKRRKIRARLRQVEHWTSKLSRPSMATGCGYDIKLEVGGAANAMIATF
jgi:hypothetical protein